MNNRGCIFTAVTVALLVVIMFYSGMFMGGDL